MFLQPCESKPQHQHLQHLNTTLQRTITLILQSRELLENDGVIF